MGRGGVRRSRSIKNQKRCFSAVSPVFPLPPRGDYPIVYHKRGRITTGSREGAALERVCPRDGTGPRLPSKDRDKKRLQSKRQKIAKTRGRTSVHGAGICEKRSEKSGKKRAAALGKRLQRLQYFLGKKGLIWAQSIHFSQKGMFSKFEFFFIGSCKMCAKWRIITTLWSRW